MFINARYIKPVAVFLLCFSLFGFYQPRRASAEDTGVAFLAPELAVLVTALMAEVGLTVVSGQGQQILSADYWSNLPEDCKNVVMGAYDASENGVVSLEMTTDLMQGMVDARSAVVDNLDNGTTYTFSVEGDLNTLTSNNTHDVSATLGSVAGNVVGTGTIHSDNVGGNTARISTCNAAGATSGFPYIQMWCERQWQGNYGPYWFRMAYQVTGYSAIYTAWGPGNDFTITPGVICGNNTIEFYFGGAMVASIVKTDPRLAFVQVLGTSAAPAVINYSFDHTDSAVMAEGVDYNKLADLINAVLAQNSALMDMVGTNQYIDTASGAVSATLPVPGTVNPAQDITGTLSWLNTIWNTIRQGFASVVAGITALSVSITGLFADPVPGWGDSIIPPFWNQWDLKFPKLPTLNMTGFSEPTFDWFITINYPMTVTFEVINSDMVERWRPTVRLWAGAVMVLFTMVYVIKKIPEIAEG